jgi:predicted metalloendopeptidase
MSEAPILPCGSAPRSAAVNRTRLVLSTGFAIVATVCLIAFVPPHQLLTQKLVGTVAGKIVPVGSSEISAGLSRSAQEYGPVPPWAQKLVNTSVDPCDDFYEYACGTWLKNTEIPDDHTSWSYSFDTAKDKIANQMRKWMDEDKGTAGILFRSCSDIASVNAKGNKPYVTSPYIKVVNDVKDSASLMKAIAMMQHIDGTAFFDFSVSPDNADPTVYSFYLQQGGISLPDRSYYLTDTHKKLMTKLYPKKAAHIMKLCGVKDDTADAWIKQALVVETEIAKIMKSQTVERTLYSKELLDRKGLKKLVPLFDWDQFFSDFGYPNVGMNRAEIRVDDPEFFNELAKLLKAHPAEWFQPYLHWQLMSSLVTHLSEDFVNAELDLRETIFGVAKNPPRWRMCHDTLGVDVPQVLSKLYIEKAFDRHTRHVAMYLVHNLREVFAEDLKAMSWMTNKTLTVALEKLKNMFAQIGHPEKFKPFPYEVKEHEWFDNAVKMQKYQVIREMKKLGTKVDRQAWGTSGPMEVNAFYSMHVNGIFVPAGILQPPFFTASYPMAWNYGAIGTIIGHEMTHGFDDQGSRFDEKGRLKKWWDKSVVKAYTGKKECFEKAYSSYKVDGMHVKGNLTIGENIADNGGMRLAWLALKKLTEPHKFKVGPVNFNGKGLPKDLQLTAHKQFFLGWGQTWCSKTHKKMAKVSLLTDVHSPDKVRVNAVLSNFKPFADTFKCKAGANMNPESKCRIW